MSCAPALLLCVLSCSVVDMRRHAHKRGGLTAACDMLDVGCMERARWLSDVTMFRTSGSSVVVTGCVAAGHVDAVLRW